MSKINVLIFPCGSENAMEIHTSLKDCVNIEVFGASSKKDHGYFVYKNYIEELPFIQEEHFLKNFNKALRKYNIDIVFPTHDTVALFLAENLNDIAAKVALSGLEQARICRYKSETYRLFADTSFSPILYSSTAEIKNFPVFIKPNVGEGAKNTKVIESLNDPVFNTEWQNDYLLMEYLPGIELSVDCFSDKNGELRFAGPRERYRTFAGISVNSFTVSLTNELKEIAEVINQRLKLRGLWFFQIKQDHKGKFKLLEVSVRAAGTMNLYRNLGVNFSLLTVYDLLGYDVNILFNDYHIEVDRALINRYKINCDFHTVYIDFDDTITKNDLPNPFVMMFLYGMKNRGKKIKVITRHKFDFDKTLHRLGINKSLFDETIKIGWDQKKYKFIRGTSGIIFIDNAYSERLEVKKHLDIPVFDVDAVQSLIDWRE
jgi:hypothetical protein